MRALIYLILCLVAIAVVITFTSNNSAPTSVVFHDKYGLSLKDQPLSVFLLGSFFLGVVITYLTGFLGKITNFFNLRGEKKKFANAQSHKEQLITGRELLAAGDYDQAYNTFARLYDNDSDDILASSMLAETLIKQKNHKEALKVVDTARQNQPDNVELLFLGAKINEALDNPTASYDNLSLVLKQQPNNTAALKNIISLAPSLKRYEEGVEYQKGLLKLVKSDERDNQANNLAKLEYEKALLEVEREKKDLKTSVTAVVKRHKKFAPAIAKLAEIEAESGDYKAACKLFAKAYSAENNLSYLDRIADILIEKDEPNKALELIKKATDSSKEENKELGQIALVQIYTRLEMLNEAKETYDKLDSQVTESHPVRLLLDIAGAELVRKSGNAEEAFSSLKSSIEKMGIQASDSYSQTTKELTWQQS